MPGSKIVVVFHSDECHFCHEYLPRFRAVAAKYRGRLPIKSVKLVPKNLALLDRYKIEGLPTTAILDGANDEKLVKKLEGAITDAELVKLFEKACS